MTFEEKLKNIREHPELHKHTFDDLITCSTINGVLDSTLLDAHPTLGRNGGQKCDVISGPCSCGAWHKGKIEDGK